MLKMEEYKTLIKLRNEGDTQEVIADKIDCSRRTVIRYLNSGKIPVYKREKPTREDPFIKFKDRAEEILKCGSKNGKIPRCKDVYRTIKEEGYQGSLRTVNRKTEDLRKQLKAGKEIYFEQEVPYGEMIEGDFTEFEAPFVTGIEKKDLWIMTLKKSKGCFVRSFNNQTFESFAEGTVKGFEYFGGVSKIYRLDNLKPAVKKILRNGRNTTHRFNQLREHFCFRQSFCTPYKANEKGTVESTNRHFKDFLAYEIKTENKIFKDDEGFEEYLEMKLREYNKAKDPDIEKEKKHLSPLPLQSFPCYSIEINTVNKYGFVKAANKRYSVPAEYKYCKVEIRLYSKKIEIYYNGKLIKEHKRNTGNPANFPTIDFKDHVLALIKKPGAFGYYKHKEAFFPTDIFRELYNKYSDNKNYLKILALCKEYSVSEVELAIQTVLEESDVPTFELISSLVKPKDIKYDFNSLEPLKFSLESYDHLYGEQRAESSSRTNAGGKELWMRY